MAPSDLPSRKLNLRMFPRRSWIVMGSKYKPAFSRTNRRIPLKVLRALWERFPNSDCMGYANHKKASLLMQQFLSSSEMDHDSTGERRRLDRAHVDGAQSIPQRAARG